MSEDKLKSIDDKLSVVIKLLAINVVKNKSDLEKIKFLQNFGMTSNEIAPVVGKSPERVRGILHEKKKKGRKNKK